MKTKPNASVLSSGLARNRSMRMFWTAFTVLKVQYNLIVNFDKTWGISIPDMFLITCTN